MPFVQITMLEGRTIEQKHDLIRRLTDATAESLGGDPGRIRVVIYVDDFLLALRSRTETYHARTLIQTALRPAALLDRW